MMLGNSIPLYIILLMALAILFGVLVLGIIFLGRIYEVRNKVGDLNEELEKSDQQLADYTHPSHEPHQNIDDKENM